VTSGPVTGEREQQGREAEHSEHAGVRDQSRAESGERAEDRAAQKRNRDHRNEQELRPAVHDRDVRQNRDLDDRRDEENRGGFRAVGDDHGFRFGTSAITESSPEKSTYG